MNAVPEIAVRFELEASMRQANLITLRILAVALFMAGVVLSSISVWLLALIIPATSVACTVLVIDEIRQAKQEIIGKLAEQKKVF